MTTPPYGTFQFVGLRASLLDSAGHPVDGSKNGYFAKAVVDAVVDVDVQKGSEETLLRGDGVICATSLYPDIIKRAKLDLNFCNLDAALISLITGSLVINDSTTPVGFQVLGPNDSTPPRVCLEGWSLAWDNSVQAVPSALGSSVAYWHWVFPFFQGQIGKQTLNTKHNAVPVSGVSDVNSNITADGPYDDWPLYVAEVGGITRPYGVFLDTSFPDLADGYLAVTSAAS